MCSMGALIWLVAAIILIAAEILSGDFFLLMLGLGALAGSGAHLLSDSTGVSLAVFAVVSLGLVSFARPWLRRRFHGAVIPTNTQALIGERAIALSDVDRDTGTVKLQGEVWTARTYDDSRIEAGRRVTVMDISGATAIVAPAPD